MGWKHTPAIQQSSCGLAAVLNLFLPLYCRQPDSEYTEFCLSNDIQMRARHPVDPNEPIRVSIGPMLGMGSFGMVYKGNAIGHSVCTMFKHQL